MKQTIIYNHFIYKLVATILCWLFIFFAKGQLQNTQQFILQAQQKRVKISTLNYEQGLQSNTIHHIITDNNGFLWVATEAGLQRFNGYNFESITPIINQKKIPITQAAHLFLLKNNDIWISYANGIMAFNAEKLTFKNIIENNSTKQNGYLILVETATEIWFVDEEKGICTWNKKTAIIEVVFTNLNPLVLQQFFNRPQVGNTAPILTPVVATNTAIFIGGINTVLKIDYTVRKYSVFPIATTTIFSLQTDGNNLLVAHSTAMEWKDITTGVTVKRLPYASFVNYTVNKVLLDKIGDNLLLGINNNLYLTNKTVTKFTYFTTLNNTPLLPVGFINTIYADVFNRIWLITNNDLKRIQYTDLPFSHYYYANAKNNFTKSILFDEQTKQLITGCYGGGIQYYDSMGKPTLTTPITAGVLVDVINMVKMEGAKYLITPFYKPWQYFDIITKKSIPIKINPLVDSLLGSTKVNFINNVKKVGENNYTIATSKNIFKCTFQQQKLLTASPIFTYLGNEDSYLCFLQTTTNTIWTGTRKGKLFLKYPNGTIQTIPNSGNYFIRAAAEDSTGNIWIGTDKGLHLFHPNGSLIKSFYTYSGLKNDCIYAILPIAKKAAVFVSTNLGLSEISINGDVKNYAKELGLQENEFNTGAAFKNEQGKLFFGGINGVTAFTPVSLNAPDPKLQLHLSRIVINDSTYPYPSAIWQSDSMLLQNYQNHLQFDIVANGILNATEYSYQYRVKGFEENWQTTSNPTSIRYTLQPGSYTLEIECTPMLNDGQKIKKNIFIHIQPAWHQLIWVRALLVLLALTLVGFMVYQYQRIVYLRKLKALQIQNELQKDRERISRELHDNLGTQLSYISSNTDFMINIDEKLTSVDRKQKLEQINTIAKSSIADLRETIWTLKKTAIAIEELGERIKLYAQSHTQQIKITYTEKINQNILLSSLITLHLFRLCQEAINNTMKYAKATNLTITLSNNNLYSYHIEIEDDGIGFVTNGITGEHYGIENMKARAAELDAYFNITSQPNKGTTIIIYKLNQKPA